LAKSLAKSWQGGSEYGGGCKGGGGEAGRRRWRMRRRRKWRRRTIVIKFNNPYLVVGELKLIFRLYKEYN